MSVVWWGDRQIDVYENITSPKLRLRAVKIFVKVNSLDPPSMHL